MAPPRSSPAKRTKPTPGKPSPLGVPWADRRGQTSAGMDVAGLEAAAERLRGQVDAGQLPGFVSCVIKDGRLVHYDAHGSSDVCSQAPLGPDTLIRLYSQTKPVTVVGALILIERGLLSLEDPLAKHVPSFAKLNVNVEPEEGSEAEAQRQPLAREVTVRDLLAHTSGVGFGPGFFNEPENDYEKAYVDLVGRVDKGEIRSLAEWCDEVAKVPLRFQPGADWGYGYSSDILGRVVEVASGKPLDEFLTKEVLEPLGMTDTAFAVAPEKAKRLSTLYSREPWDGASRNVKLITVDAGGSGKVEDQARRVYAQNPDGSGRSAPSASVFLRGSASKVVQGGGCVCSVAGGLVSTLHDYARFGMMLLNEGDLDGVRILRPESVRLLAQDWLNDFSPEKREEPLWVWGTTGIGFSPLGQIGVEAEGADRRTVGSQLHTVHWGGAGGSGYMLNWPHRVLVLTYTGCAFDTWTQKAMWRATFGALRRGGAKPPRPWPPAAASAPGAEASGACGGDEAPSETPGSKRPRGSTGGANGVAQAASKDDKARAAPGGQRGLEEESSQKATPSKRRRVSNGNAAAASAAAAAASALSSSASKAPGSAAKRRKSTSGAAPAASPPVGSARKGANGAGPATARRRSMSAVAPTPRGSAKKK